MFMRCQRRYSDDDESDKLEERKESRTRVCLVNLLTEICSITRPDEIVL